MTNMIAAYEGTEVLRTDSKGRVRMRLERREALLKEFEQSGLSGKKFAALVGVKYQTFATWARKRRREDGLPAPKEKEKPVRWLEAVVEPKPRSGQRQTRVLKLEWPGGASLEITQENQVPLVAALLRAMEKPC